MGAVGNMVEYIKKYHPCFNHQAHFLFGRVHLPVAPKCNIKCRYCVIKINNYEDRPAVAQKILKPQEAITLLKNILRKSNSIKVVAVAGPGEPLINSETFETFRIVDAEFPDLIRCIATNGLLLKEKVNLLKELNINTITVTANTTDPKVGKEIYKYITLDGKTYTGIEGAKILIEHQKQGVKEAVSKGMLVKINTVLIPELNLDHLEDIAKTYKDLGATIMNIMPLIPQGGFKDLRSPTYEELIFAQKICSKHIEQFRLCKQCRADACGIPGLEGAVYESLGRTCI